MESSSFLRLLQYSLWTNTSNASVSKIFAQQDKALKFFLCVLIVITLRAINFTTIHQHQKMDFYSVALLLHVQMLLRRGLPLLLRDLWSRWLFVWVCASFLAGRPSGGEEEKMARGDWYLVFSCHEARARSSFRRLNWPRTKNIDRISFDCANVKLTSR
jgi:hypothetical protein